MKTGEEGPPKGFSEVFAVSFREGKQVSARRMLSGRMTFFQHDGPVGL